jgi:hypothetical protein
MAETFVQLPSDAANTGKLEDHFSVTGGNLREAIVVGDPVLNTAVATVSAANGLQVDVTRVTGNVAETVADGANVTQGAIADAAVTGDNTGTVSAKLRGLSKILADVWSSANHWLNVSIQNATLAVTQSGTWTVLLGLATSGGYTNLSINAANSNNATSVKGTPGQVYGVHVYNNATYPVYVKLYNKATAPAPAADNALLVRRIGVQAGTQRDFAFASGLPFSTGIGLAIVKGISDTDNTSVAASDCLAEVEYA